MKPLHIDGMTFTREIINDTRDEVIRLRDAALLRPSISVLGKMNETVVLSHTIALLAHLAENTEE